MGTHPIFESDFDCLTEMRTTLARAGFNHANRVGYTGYGHRFHPEEIVVADKRAFREMKISAPRAFSWAFVAASVPGAGSMPHQLRSRPWSRVRPTPMAVARVHRALPQLALAWLSSTCSSS